MRELRIGIIGLGNIGTAHANCIVSGKIAGAKLSVVCDINPERFSLFPDIPNCLNHRDLISSNVCDGVIISTPHPSHAEIAAECLKAGLHVLVEKPMDISLSRADKLAEIAKNSDRTFAVMFNQRTNPLFIKARDIVSSGLIGELKRSNWTITNWYRTQHYYDSGAWRATWSGEGGGVLLNQAPHNLDLWQWICGMPCEITAFCNVAKYHNIEVEDDCTIYAKYPGGATGVFITSTGELPGTNRLEICGTLGKIVLEDNKLKWWRLKESERTTCFESKNPYPDADCEYTELTSDNYGGAHREVIQAFVGNILNGTPLVANGVEGVNELSISNAAYLSQWLGNVPVKLPFDKELFDKLLAEHRTGSFKKPQSDLSSPKGDTAYSKRWQTNW